MFQNIIKLLMCFGVIFSIGKCDTSSDSQQDKTKVDEILKEKFNVVDPIKEMPELIYDDESYRFEYDYFKCEVKHSNLGYMLVELIPTYSNVSFSIPHRLDFEYLMDGYTAIEGEDAIYIDGYATGFLKAGDSGHASQETSEVITFVFYYERTYYLFENMLDLDTFFTFKIEFFKNGIRSDYEKTKFVIHEDAFNVNGEPNSARYIFDFIGGENFAFLTKYFFFTFDRAIISPKFSILCTLTLMITPSDLNIPDERGVGFVNIQYDGSEQTFENLRSYEGVYSCYFTKHKDAPEIKDLLLNHYEDDLEFQNYYYFKSDIRITYMIKTSNPFGYKTYTDEVSDFRNHDIWKPRTGVMMSVDAYFDFEE